MVVSGDMADFEAMREATEGVDAIVHLALLNRRQNGTEAERARGTIDVDIKSCYNIYEAARINGVDSVVFASTNHVTGLNETGRHRLTPRATRSPRRHLRRRQGFGEALGRYYADRLGVRVLCLRIANFQRKRRTGKILRRGAHPGG